MNDRFDPFAGSQISHTVPLTPEQEEIWLSVQLGGLAANLAYNESIVLRIDGTIDVAALQRALNKLVDRHEALRCTLGGDGRQVCVLSQLPLPLELHDVADLDALARTDALEAVKRRSVGVPFDLAWGPLVRATLVRSRVDRHALVFVAHHLVCDGWSMGVIVRELGMLYAAERQGVPPSLIAGPQLSDYARLRLVEQQSAEMASAVTFWLDQYRDVPPALELPLDLARPAERRMDAERIDVPLPLELVRGLKSTAARLGVSFVVLQLAALQAFLHRITGQTSIVIAVPVAGQLVSGMDSLVGHCVRTLPVRAEVDSTLPFGTFVLLSRSGLLDATEHSLMTFGDLVKRLTIPRDPSRLPLVSVMFNVDPDMGSLTFDGMPMAIESVPRAYDNFEWYLNATLRGDAVTLESTFNSSLFDAAPMRARLAGFEAMLADIVADPSQTIGELRVMSDAERAQLLSGSNDTEKAVPAATLVAEFLRFATATPDATAVVSGATSLSYAHLDRASAALAQELLDAGVATGQLVGVLLPRSVDLLIAFLGVLRAGAAYVPLDPAYPADRVDYIVDDTALRACVTDASNEGRLAPTVRRILLDRDLVGPVALDRSVPSGAAYTIYTSGSTGRPKGVVIEHRNVTNFLSSMTDIIGIDAASRMVAVTTPSFDISVLELFLPLTVGATVVIASDAEVTDGQALAHLLETSQATHFQATPAGYRVLLDAGWRGRRALTALVGGEALTGDLAATLRPCVGNLWNCYGPTETTVWSTVDRVEDGPVTIGKPIGNTRVYVLDGALRPVPRGVTGELFIGGAGVARGYWQRESLTTERFLSDPFVAGGRIYRTGDLVRLRIDGRLEWLGRSDFQVKVRGHRIELGEVQARLTDIAGVLEAVVIVREDRPRDQRIVAYVRVSDTVLPLESAMRDALRRVLPSYMVPQHIVTLPGFPLTPNGKVDRRALPPPLAAGAESHRTPATAVAVRLASEIAQLVGVARVGLDDDFFALGGHSLLALRLAGTVRSIWAVELPMRTLFRAPTLLAISEFIEASLLLRSVGTTGRSTEQDEFLI